jgi:hypothetical protein
MAEAASAAEALVPPTIQYDEVVFDLAFHPHRPLVAAGLISGRLTL